MSALPALWGTSTIDLLELNARSMQSQIDDIYREIEDLRERVRYLEKKAEAPPSLEKNAVAPQSAKRAGSAIAKPATKKAAKKARA